jgi:hypothetical protein
MMELRLAARLVVSTVVLMAALMALMTVVTMAAPMDELMVEVTV